MNDYYTYLNDMNVTASRALHVIKCGIIGMTTFVVTECFRSEGELGK